LGQAVQGDVVDVNAVKSIEAAMSRNKAVAELPKVEQRLTEALDAPTPIKQDKVTVENGEFNTKGQSKVFTKDIYNNEVSQPSGKSLDNAFNVLEAGAYTESPEIAVPVKSIKPTQKFLSADNLDKVFDAEVETGAFLYKKGDEFFVLDGHHRIASNIIKGEPSIKAFIFDGDNNKMLTSKYNRTSSLQAKKSNLEATARQEIDNNVLQTAQNNILKTNKSSAYDADIKKDEVYEKTKNTPEEQLVEAELEDYQAELLAMQEEGQLTANDMEILERLAQTQDEIDIFDNIYDNLSICLTRG
jgi:hypothetical protein